ncbi:MAG: PIN domain-containing protein [Patescibacteria group bacterium]
MKKVLNKYQRIGIDTNVFIYYLNKNSSYYSQTVDVFTLIAEKQSILVTSVITLTELLSFKTNEAIAAKLEREFVLIPNLQLIEINRAIAQNAAKIRRVYGFALVDSIQLATAVGYTAQVFITNDKKLTRFKELKVLMLSSL